MKFEVIEIDSKKAEEMLSKNKENRTISYNRVLSLARDMKEGRWNQNNPQPIIFGESGRLLDGQHRLAAVCKADAKIRFVVITEIPDDTINDLDKGGARSSGDVLKINGIKHYNTVSGISKKILAYEKGVNQVLSGHAGGTGLSAQSVNNTEAVVYAFANKDYLSALSETAERMYHNSVLKLFSTSEIGFLLHILKPYDMAFEFLNKIITGTGLSEKTAEQAMRRVLERAKITRELALTPGETLEYVLVAYSKFLKNEPTEYIRIKRFSKQKKG